ncbi:MAG: hypothetical protein JO215_02065 [Ktedonobacteraceae bacterium]|nr:hypothetical protein [Ktedonobacteraceae bacterium]
MRFLRLPKLMVSSNLPNGDQITVRPLQKCSACRYVLCSCGKCHSEACQETCLYESGELQEPDFEGMSERLKEMLRNRLE